MHASSSCYYPNAIPISLQLTVYVNTFPCWERVIKPCQVYNNALEHASCDCGANLDKQLPLLCNFVICHFVLMIVVLPISHTTAMIAKETAMTLQQQALLNGS